MVLSYRGWRTRFGGDPNIIGAKVQVDGREFTVLGIAAQGFDGTELMMAPEIYFSMAMQKELQAGEDLQEHRSARNFFAVGRLKPGISLEAAESALDGIAQNLAKEYPQEDGGMQIKLSPPGLVGAYVRKPLIGFVAVMFGVSCLVLLVACVIQESTEAAAVFAGYGFHVPEKNYDDLAGLDVKGKIVVYLAGGPKSIPGPLKSHYQSAAERWKYLKAAGAVGVANIQNPKSMDIPWSRASLARLMPSMTLADPSLQETAGLRLSIAINPERADKFFEGSGHTIAEILAAADNDQALPRFPLAVTIRARVHLKKSEAESQNVAGVLTGSDPKLKNEYVVLTAHLDHVGVGPAINGDSIYNGAMDDASNIASILEIARMLHESDAKLRRSVVFLAVTGEEKGLQGSRYFAEHPTVNEKNIVADINLDMFLPLHALHYIEVQGLAESTLGDDIRTVAKESGVELQADKEPQRNLFIRSDRYSFIRKGIPALAFKFGYLPGSPEEKLHKEWLKKRYHAPSDDLNQPVDKTAAAQFNEIILKLAERVANAPERPQWNADSFFRRFASGS